MSDLLFDAPWWLPACIIAIGLIVFLTANRRVGGEGPTKATRVRNVGLGIVGLGLLVIALSYFIDTDKEKVIKRSRELVGSVEQRDWEKMKSLLDPEVQFKAYERQYNGRDQLVASAKTTAETVGLNTARVIAVVPREDGSSIMVDIQVIGDSTKAAGQAVPSEWTLEWRKRPDQGWVTTDIQLKKFGNLSDNAVKSQLPF